MTHFATAITKLLAVEGGYVNHPHDPGGATNYGITLRAWRALYPHATAVDIQNLSRHAAIDYYRTQWWDVLGYDRIGDATLATKVFCTAVNMGAHMAHRLLQRACWSCGHTIAEDGMLGAKTISAINNIPSVTLLAALRSEMAGHYRVLVARNQKLSVFLTGWLSRAYDMSFKNLTKEKIS